MPFLHLLSSKLQGLFCWIGFGFTVNTVILRNCAHVCAYFVRCLRVMCDHMLEFLRQSVSILALGSSQ